MNVLGIFRFLVVILLAANSHASSFHLFSEIFGSNTDPAIILNAGAGNQCLTWPESLCYDLAQRGFFVIRYDYRDMGESSAIEYESNPYTVMDLAQDAVFILQQHKIEKAAFVGFSMGGQLAQLAAAYIPERVTHVILIGTSCDFRPWFQSFSGQRPSFGLSGPSDDCLKLAQNSTALKEQSLENKVEDYLRTWRLLDGFPTEFDEQYFKQQGSNLNKRSRTELGYLHHTKAMQASCDLHEQAAQLIKQPTLIIHGDKDPVFPPDHGVALKECISNSKLEQWDSFGHAISPQHFKKIIDAIDKFIRTNS